METAVVAGSRWRPARSKPEIGGTRFRILHCFSHSAIVFGSAVVQPKHRTGWESQRMCGLSLAAELLVTRFECFAASKSWRTLSEFRALTTTGFFWEWSDLCISISSEDAKQHSSAEGLPAKMRKTNFSK